MKNSKSEIATFWAGCFWHVEAEFRKVKGITTTVGYMGGSLKNPTYEDVCSDKTGHAEVVQIEYKPSKISYEKLLNIFWSIHDPTTLNRQGPDVGTQYRSVIFYYNERQKKVAIKSKEKLQKYDVGNLFIADLPDYWRMIYTLESDEIEIIAFILDIINHNEYNKKFGFRKR